MAEEIERRYEIAPDLIPSSGGVFEVTVDGALIFSKKALGRFPEDGEISTKIAERKKG